MIPPLITNKLARVRRKEQTQRLFFGLGRVLGVILVFLLVACFVDWIFDRFEDTPLAVRGGLLFGQIALGLALLVFWVVLPMSRPLPDDQLALWVEADNPRLAHRLISAVQLNRSGADKAGMSPELIHVVTREAERQAERIDFGRVVDSRRLLLGLAFAAPALFFFVLAWLIFPSVFPILLARQFLADVEIPRRVYLTVVSGEVWPNGETVRLEVEAAGPGAQDEDLDGEIVVTWSRGDMPASTLPLRRVLGTDRFYAEVREKQVDFTFAAYVGDGRLKNAGNVRYVPRPEVREQATVLLPSFCGLTPQGERYERPAGAGTVQGVPGSGARVSFETQKPVYDAQLHVVIAPRPADDKDDQPRRYWRRSLPVPLDSTRMRGERVIPLAPFGTKFDAKNRPLDFGHFDWEGSYAIEVSDVYGFDNRPRPTRAFQLIPEPRPDVFLLKEQFPPDAAVPEKYLELYVHAGMPAREGETLRVGYKAFGDYGLGLAKLRYRKLAVAESGDMEVKEAPWAELDLPEEIRAPFSFGGLYESGKEVRLVVQPSLHPLAHLLILPRAEKGDPLRGREAQAIKQFGGKATLLTPSAVMKPGVLYRLELPEKGESAFPIQVPDNDFVLFSDRPLDDFKASVESAGAALKATQTHDYRLGRFLIDQGVFEKTPADKSVPFHAEPSADAQREMGRLKGGGRYDLQLKKLDFKKGDQIEYQIKIYADPSGSEKRPWNVSETRVTAIEDSLGVWTWLQATWQEQDRIRSLEKSQRGVFEKGK